MWRVTREQKHTPQGNSLWIQGLLVIVLTTFGFGANITVFPTLSVNGIAISASGVIIRVTAIVVITKSVVSELLWPSEMRVWGLRSPFLTNGTTLGRVHSSTIIVSDAISPTFRTCIRLIDKHEQIRMVRLISFLSLLRPRRVPRREDMHGQHFNVDF